MTNLITGLLAVVLLSVFTGGLAISIGSIEFGVIVVIVLIMCYVDFFESVWKNWRDRG
jgi:hypothetical protein